MTDTPEAVALKPCPFCGERAELFTGCETSWVMCDRPGCGTEQTHDTAQQAITAWNARPADDLVRQLVEALREMVYETTSLSPMEDDGSHWCKIRADTLADARKALQAARAQGYSGQP